MNMIYLLNSLTLMCYQLAMNWCMVEPAVRFAFCSFNNGQLGKSEHAQNMFIWFFSPVISKKDLTRPIIRGNCPELARIFQRRYNHRNVDVSVFRRLFSHNLRVSRKRIKVRISSYCIQTGPYNLWIISCKDLFQVKLCTHFQDFEIRKETSDYFYSTYLPILKILV